MRVAFCPSAFAPAIGGSEIFTAGLAAEMHRHGAEAHVVVADIASAEAFFEAGHAVTGRPAREQIDGITVHRIGLLSRRHSPGDPRRTLVRNRRRFDRNLRRTLGRLDPDVVVALPHLLPNVAAAVELRTRSRWRLVYAPHLHEEDPWWPTDRVADAVRRADGVIALTAHERDRLVASYGANPARVAVVPPAVELPAEVITGPRPPVVLYLGRLAPSKRIDVLVEAMRVVWNSVPEARFIAAGPSWSASSEALEALRDDPRVEILGPVSPAERSTLLSRVRVVATASVIEAFGITTLEAWAHSTPVVVADTPVARSVVRHGEDGLVAERSAAGMAQQLLLVLGDDEWATAMGRAGRGRVETEFTWERSGTLLSELIDRL